MVRRLQQRAAELQRKEDVKYCTTQLQFHSDIVGLVKRLVDRLMESARKEPWKKECKMQTRSGGEM